MSRHSSRGKQWEATRLRVLARDGHLCIYDILYSMSNKPSNAKEILANTPDRVCSICGYEGPATDFTVTRWVGETIYFNGRCRPCYNAYYREKNKKPHNVAKRRDRDYKKKYGITKMDYDAMHDEQAGTCAICGKPQTWRTLVVDHNHITGAVRGLLCDLCNKGIGLLMADNGTDILQRAIEYIEKAA